MMNQKLSITIPILIVTMILLAACSSTATPPSLSGTTWKLVSYGPLNGQVPAESGIETSLVFGSDGQASGNLGCNSFGGAFTQKDDQVTFGPLASTMMACPDPQMTQESTAFQVLTGSVKFKVDGDTLTITSSAGDIALILSKQ
jgi:heat shock protein HslJ